MFRYDSCKKKKNDEEKFMLECIILNYYTINVKDCLKNSGQTLRHGCSSR